VLRTVVVVGGSLAGLRAVETLRLEGFDGTITVVGAERHLPYERPPLSKQVLAGAWELDRIWVGPVGTSIDELDVDWRLGVPASSLDLTARTVGLADGSTVAFDGLVITTGAHVRRLERQPDWQGLHVLRTLDDCVSLRRDLDASPSRVVVVGAGFIGAEVAATARDRGLDVTLLEALPVPLQRGLGDEMGAVVADIHRDHGVDVRLATGVSGFHGTGRVEAVVLSDGTTLPCDVVVVGVGVSPATEWLIGSGLRIDDGVVCDATLLAAPGVVAAGDVARWHNPLFDEEMRVEHWDNAQDQGEAAARRLLAGEGAGVPFTPVPWFWSDQYDRKIQLAGRPSGADEVRVVDGSVADRQFVALYRRGDRIAAVLGMNRPRLVMQYRQLIASRASWDEATAPATS
jgi:NADPH-dependent 2,4-dienoyl-CoA reductase/sulfur reductase-like enzyme